MADAAPARDHDLRHRLTVIKLSLQRLDRTRTLPDQQRLAQWALQATDGLIEDLPGRPLAADDGATGGRAMGQGGPRPLPRPTETEGRP